MCPSPLADTWENNWGWWNGISPRDGETMRRIFTIFRAFENTTSSCGWRPYYPYFAPANKMVDAAATLFPSADRLLLTVVNTKPTGAVGDYTVTINATLAGDGWRWFDLWNGKPVKPQLQLPRSHHNSNKIRHTGGGSLSKTALSTSFTVTGTTLDEYGAITAVAPEVADSSSFILLLKTMSDMSKSTLGSFSAKPVGSTNYSFVTTSSVNSTTGTAPPPSSRQRLNKTGMVAVPATADYTFQYQVQQIVKAPSLYPLYPLPYSKYDGSDGPHPKMAMGSFLIDKYPVTNANFKTFVTYSEYTPTDKTNFLRHWSKSHNGSATTPTVAPANLTESPVVWVSLADAEAYCEFQGKRLPEEWEWAYAAQGLDSRRWPWGNAARPACMPPSFNKNGSPATELPPVSAFDSLGCHSPFGMAMSVGAVWQWTNKVQDAHTATAILKGGSVYFRQNASFTPSGGARSSYYFGNCASDERLPEPAKHPPIYMRPIECHAQYYLMDGGYERASTIGFRCAADNGGPIPPQPSPPQPPAPAPQPSPPRPTPSGSPRWYGGSSSTAPSFRWSDGSPDKVSGAGHPPASVKSGMFTYTGTFTLVVRSGNATDSGRGDASTVDGRRVKNAGGGTSTAGRSKDAVEGGGHADMRMRVLKLYAGLYCTAAQLTVSAPGAAVPIPPITIVIPQPVPGSVAHCKSSGRGFRTLQWSIYFPAATEKLLLTWRKPARPSFDNETRRKSAGDDGEDDEEDDEGNVTWHAAAVEAVGGSGPLPSGCTGSKSVCVLQPVDVDPNRSTDLTADGSLDWVHWGGLNSQPWSGAPLYPEQKAGGPGLLLGGFEPSDVF